MVVDCAMGVYVDNDHKYDHNDAIYDMFSPNQRCDPLAKIGFLTLIRNTNTSNRMTHTVVVIVVRGG